VKNVLFFDRQNFYASGELSKEEALAIFEESVAREVLQSQF
jgi:hypothetical protein